MMTFRTADDIRALLKSSSLSIRDLHLVWEQRQPIPGGRRRRDRSNECVGQIAWLQGDITLARLFTKRALEKEEYLLVCDAASEILRLEPALKEDGRTELVRVRMDYAAALTRLGFTRAARGELEPCVSPAFQPILGRKLKADILMQLGDILREESHHAPARAMQFAAAEDALRFYREAQSLNKDRLEAHVQVAATSFIMGESGSALLEQARQEAHRILDRTKKMEGRDGSSFQTTLARATANVILGDVDAAASGYGKLQSFPGVTTARLAEVRFRSRFLAEALGYPREYFKEAFPPLQLIVLAGHLPDKPGERGRFPQKSIRAVRKAIRIQLEKMHARVGLVSASAGADLLFIEALLERNGTVHIVLPWSQEEFRRTSVLPFETPGRPRIWEPLFERALREAATIREIGQVYEPGNDIGWDFMVEVTAGIALHTARASRLDIQPMVLWDGLPGRGAGGTDSFHTFWRRQLRQDPIVIPLPPSPRQDEHPYKFCSHRCERPNMHQEVKSMLFADIVGYSKLTEKVIPEFVGTFLGRVSCLVATSKSAPCSINTWGDGIFAVFDFAHDAGRFALELIELVAGETEKKEWLDKGLYWEENLPGHPKPIKHPLNLRIGLHCGPVVMHYDPIVRRLGFTGVHVNRAARIEPIAQPGEIFASEEFAAMAELGDEIQLCRSSPDGDIGSGFICEYAGTMQLSKGYPGRYRIYRVVPKKVLDLEDLATAIHEDYYAEARIRGDDPTTNTSLRPWETLPEDLKDANRAQAADIPNKLRLLGFELAPSHGMSPLDIPLTDEQVKHLAIREHDRWMAERIRSGWGFGKRRDNARKRHPLLVPWDSLTEEQKDLDRNTIRKLRELVHRAGFRVRPIGFSVPGAPFPLALD